IGPAVVVLAENGGKESHKRRPPYRRAHVEPGAVLPDLHVDVASEGWIPPLHRRQALAGACGARNQCLQPPCVGGRCETVLAVSRMLVHGREKITVGALVSHTQWFKWAVAGARPRTCGTVSRRGGWARTRNEDRSCMSVIVKASPLGEKEMVAEAERALADI